MEDDRAATNLGPEVDEGISEEPTVAPKQPRKRFVGRKTAEKAGEQQADPNANIEDSSAIQGVRRLRGLICTRSTNEYYSRPASPYCSRAERASRLDTTRSRDQRCDRTTTTQLQLRNSQMHTPHTHIRRKVDSIAVPRGLVAVCDHHIRHPHTLLFRDYHTHNGRCHLRRMLHR
jgi:hypothetical protein